MANTIVGTLPINHTVDQNGSFTINIPLQLPQAKVMPTISLSYHSAANNPSAVGLGWVIKGASLIQRVPATVAQDGFRGVVNYDKDDRFALDGQRLIRLTPTGNEYRFELEQWSKITAHGDPINPDYWEEHLPNGTSRKFGATTDSNIKAQGGTATRVWAITEHSDAFSNYISFAYNNDTHNGSFYLTKLAYGGNRHVAMAHQREVTLEYEDRQDKRTYYEGGHRIGIGKRLVSITSRVHSKVLHTHILHYDIAPLTLASRLRTLTLADSSGATVRPLKFDWNDGHPSVFDSVRKITDIDTGSSTAEIIPLDVKASGRSDIVIASRRLQSQSYYLDLAVHEADGLGNISPNPSPGSGPTGLRYPTQLLPLEFNGDGKMDLLHIEQFPKDSYTLTVLLSTKNGYEKKYTLQFKPESTKGHFYSGDFEGNGRVGLIYVYQLPSGKDYQLKVVQFTSDQSTSDEVQFRALPAFNGPIGSGVDETHVVVADLNGNGAEDVFLITRKLKGASYFCHIELVQSVNGTLSYRADKPLVSIGESVLFTDSTTFLPYAADGNSKTGLLIVSKTSQSKLQWQLLRSTGPSLLASPRPTATDIPFDGNVTLAKTSSTYGTDLVNTFNTGKLIRVHVLRFDSENFYPIDNVQQPTDAYVTSLTAVRWADLRGVGRADCTLHTLRGVKLAIHSMPCASPQPVDFICGYETGLGAKITVDYASLSDNKVYTADEDPTFKPTTAALNAMARNVSSSVSLPTSTHQSTAQTIGHGRTQVVHFPAFVVKGLSNCPRTALPEVFEHQAYAYKNARLAFDGRGWLGFDSIAKTLQPIGICETTSYYHNFPLLGQTSQVETQESQEAGGKLLQTNTYAWDHILVNDDKNYSVLLRGYQEKYYEAGKHSYDVDVTYHYDPYANIEQIDTVSSQPGVPALTIQSTFENTVEPWVIGNKTLEVVKQQTKVLKQTEHAYVPGTQIIKETRSWVVDSTWSTRGFEFDDAGNEKVVHGPGPSRRMLTYDSTHTNVISTSIFPEHEESSALTETATWDLALGKPLTVTDANGHTILRSYDVLGRIKDISQAEDISHPKVIEKHSFHFEGGNFFESRQVNSGSTKDDSHWSTTKVYVDGLKQSWRVETSRPDDPLAMICSEVVYDGAGRIAARSRDYLAGSTPVFSEYTYDTRSRVIKEVSPPAAVDVSPITTIFDYTFESGLAKSIETRFQSKVTTDEDRQIITRELLYLPNPEPSTGKLIKPFVTRLINELGQGIQTQFDGLGRPVSTKDPSDVELSLVWDGLSRQVDRRISKPGGNAREVTSHFSVKYEDNICQNTVTNELTGSTIVTKSDFTQRPISKKTTDETLTFKYDTGGKYMKERLATVSSSKGIVQNFDYDIQGHLTLAHLSIDGHDFTTTHEWTPAGQLFKTTNPDGTEIHRSFLADGETVRRIELSNAKNVSRASVTLDGYDNVFSRPLTCEFGNGITSTSSIENNGSLAHTTLSRGSEVLHHQKWKINAFSQIEEHDVDHTGLQSTSNTFQYDLAGQLKLRSPDSSASSTESETFSYDQSGNLSFKDGRTFINDGWQLSSIQNKQKITEFSFKYTVDGNMSAKLNANGAVMRKMTYDADGRLVDLDKTAFVYDYGGRLIKSVLPNGDVTIYPSQTYEVHIPASGKRSHTTYLIHGYRRASLTTEEEDPETTSSSIVHYFHTDHLGSTIAASDEAGKIITQYQYDPFGKVISVDGPDVARYKFSGKEKFGELYYFGARFYDPDIGRFLTLDNYSISLRQITPSTFNMYTFSRNDPINYIDLNGNVSWWHWFVDAVLIVAGAIVTFIPLPGMTVLGSTLLGAGIKGLTYDIEATVNNNGKTNDSDWGIQLGLGAAFGFAGGVLGAGLDAILPALSTADVAVVRGIGGFFAQNAAAVTGLVARTAIRVAANAALDSSLSVLQQIAENAVAGKPLNDDLGTAAWMGVAASPSSAFSVFEVGSMSRKLWKTRKWSKYIAGLKELKTSLTPRAKLGQGISGEAQYPLAQVAPTIPSIRNRSSPSFASAPGTSTSTSVASSSFDFSAMERFMQAQDVTSL